MKERCCILCEGTTDCFLLEYYMQKVNGWLDIKEKYEENKKRVYRYSSKCWSREFYKDGKALTITEVGGVKSLTPALKNLLMRNQSAIDDEDFYNKIVIFTDNDEVGTAADWAVSLKSLYHDLNITLEECKDSCFKCKMKNDADDEVEFSIDLMIIPFEEQGALETFLLNSIARKNSYEGAIISKGNVFVEGVDLEKRFLNHRRLVTKAKFDVFFSVRTPYEAFAERRSILKSIPWEEYLEVRKEFEKLGEL